MDAIARSRPRSTSAPVALLALTVAVPPVAVALPQCLPNCAGASLFESTLQSADLSGADLSFATLAHADLSDADLTGADLTGADLPHVLFQLLDPATGDAAQCLVISETRRHRRCLGRMND